MRPSAASSEVVGNWSKTTITTGERAATLAMLTSASPPKTSLVTGEKHRKITTKSSGAGESAVSTVRRTPALR